MFVIGLAAVLAFVTLGLSIAVLAARWQAWPRRRRSQVVLLVGWHMTLLAIIGLLIWPLSSPGREQALQTAGNLFPSVYNHGSLAEPDSPPSSQLVKMATTVIKTLA